MPIFNYQAYNDAGRRVKGEMTAINEMDLEERLRTIGLDLINWGEQKIKKPGIFSRVKLKDLILFCVQMEQLNRAGVPLLDALSDARDATESGKLRGLLADIYESVKNGEQLSESMGKHPRVFNAVFTGLISTGEFTGNLTESFEHLAHHMKWVGDMRRNIRKAMTYPITLVVVLMGVITILMLYVVPKITGFMIAQNFDLPIHTRALIAASDFMGHYWYMVFGGIIGTFVGLMTLRRTSEKFAYQWDKMVLKVPVIGGTARKIDLARFTHFFGVMFKSGIGILECLDGAKQVVNNRIIQDAVSMARNSVANGMSLTESLRTSSQFPNMVVRMFKIGEESGDMHTAIDNINYFYDREVNDGIDAMIAAIKPAMTVVLGLVIVWVIAGVFGPLYESFSKMKF
jgi:type IV pilus assembly protein PilC